MVSFKNAIIILTSNLGSAEIFNAAYKQKKEGGQVAGGSTYRRSWQSHTMLQHDKPRRLERPLLLKIIVMQTA